jgi:hypothetical protein
MAKANRKRSKTKAVKPKRRRKKPVMVAAKAKAAAAIRRSKPARKRKQKPIDLRLSPSVQSICKVIERSTLKPARKRKPRQKPSVAVEAIPSPMFQLLKDDTKRLQQEILILLRGEQPLPPRRIEMPVERRVDPAMIEAMNVIRSKIMRGRQTIH